jgi:hypothetical protein
VHDVSAKDKNLAGVAHARRGPAMMASRGLSITVTFQPVATSHRPLSSFFYTITVWYKSVNNAFERERGLTVT